MAGVTPIIDKPVLYPLAGIYGIIHGGNLPVSVAVGVAPEPTNILEASEGAKYCY